jgi:hypothetical protein
MTMTFYVPNRYRVTTGPYATDESSGNNGAFLIKIATSAEAIRCVASDGEGWEHVSVSFPRRTPTWEEMAFIKALFWEPEDCVVQYHPPESDYINCHPRVLRLWRPVDKEIPRPPSWMVGSKITNKTDHPHG